MQGVELHGHVLCVAGSLSVEREEEVGEGEEEGEGDQRGEEEWEDGGHGGWCAGIGCV